MLINSIRVRHSGLAESDPVRLQSRCFRVIVHEIKVLHRSACCTLDEVVETTDGQHPLPYDTDSDIAEIGIDSVLGRGEMFDNAHKRM
jgi:hypothetical protein